MQRRVVVRRERADAAVAQQQHAVGVQRERQIVLHRDHGVRAAELAAQPGQRHLVRRVEVGAGLVEQQHRRLGRQRAREQHALALAAGQRAQPPVLPGAAFAAFDRAVDDRLVGGTGRAEQPQVRQPAQVHRLARGQLAADVAGLREPGDAPAALGRGERSERALVERDATGARGQQSGECAQQRRLAGTIGADDDRPAGLEAAAQSVQHRPAAELDDQALGHQRRHATLPRRSSQSR